MIPITKTLYYSQKTNNKLYSFMLNEKQDKINHILQLIDLYNLVEENKNISDDSINPFHNLIITNKEKLSNDLLLTDLLYKHNNILCNGLYNLNYNVLTNINIMNSKVSYKIKYNSDSNDYILLSKQQHINRKTDINHLIDNWNNKKLISKNGYRKYKKYGYINQEIQQRINIYLRNSLLKLSHKKHYNALLTNRKQYNIHYIDFLKLNIKFRKHINYNHFYNSLLYSEINKRIVSELKYNVLRK
jgi:hypothetical protein